jgi:hypothetical protein
MKKIFATWILLLMVGVSLVHTQPAFEQRSLEEADGQGNVYAVAFSGW